MLPAEVIYQYHLANRGPFASLPTASTFGFGFYWVTDVGVGPGSMWQCDGVNWVPVNGSCVLAMSGTAVSAGSNVTENTLVTVVVPANVMGANGSLNVETIWSCNSSVSSKTVNIYFGTNTATGTKFLTGALSGGNQSQHDWRYIQNQNSTNSQIGGVNTATAFGTAGSAAVTATVNTVSAQNVIFSALKTSASDVATLQCYKITLNRTGS